ncbi:hypothetical protein HMI56_005218 [Coelomomyces lativittatus]|nr:hypothetical protein HMI56_005218 [Coelomomyces lativittatus]
MQEQAQAVQNPGACEENGQTQSDQVQSFVITHPHSIPDDDMPPTPGPEEYATKGTPMDWFSSN